MTPENYSKLKLYWSQSLLNTTTAHGHIYWLTGLAGSGKSTLGRALWQSLREQGKSPVYLDGDVLREVFDSSVYASSDRLALAWRYSHLCQMLATQGLDVVCATISLFHQVQAWNRQHFQHYVEIFLDIPFDELLRRDPKQLYSRALAGEIHNVVGVDIPPEWPLQPDIILKFDHVSPPELFLKLLNEIHKITTKN